MEQNAMAEKKGAWHTPQNIASRDDTGGLTRIGMSAVREKTAGMAETDLGDGWMLCEVFELHDGKPIVAEMRIFPKPPTEREDGELLDARNYGHRSPETNGDTVPQGGVTASLLRQVKPGIRHAQALLDDYRDWLGSIVEVVHNDPTPTAEQNSGRHGRTILGGVFAKDPDLKAGVIARLQQDVKRFDKQIGRPSRAKTGERRRQTDEYYAKLAMDYERLCREGSRSPVKTMAEDRDLGIGLMKSHVHRARRNGFLTDAAIGTSGGFATEKALKILKGES
jgi:hypothetical protein